MVQITDGGLYPVRYVTIQAKGTLALIEMDTIWSTSITYH